MSYANVDIQNSFIRFSAGSSGSNIPLPQAYGNCEIPFKALPVFNPIDLSFQMLINAGPTDDYMQKIFVPSPPISYIGQIGQGVLGVLVAQLAIDGISSGNTLFGNYPTCQWICTAAKYIVSQSSWVCTFQYSPPQNSPADIFATYNLLQCFGINILRGRKIRTSTSGGFDTLAAVMDAGNAPLFTSYTQFQKQSDGLDNIPTSLLQYANINDAFGFYYDFLGQLITPGINFLNSIRLPAYLYAPEPSEEQSSYSLSDGSSKKLSHRIWTDYKFRTEDLLPETIQALIVATAHDFVFITCETAGVQAFAPSSDYLTGMTTQFVRTERVEITWYSKDFTQLKLGWIETTLRFAEPEFYVNSNCD